MARDLLRRLNQQYNFAFSFRCQPIALLVFVNSLHLLNKLPFFISLTSSIVSYSLILSASYFISLHGLLNVKGHRFLESFSCFYVYITLFLQYYSIILLKYHLSMLLYECGLKDTIHSIIMGRTWSAICFLAMCLLPCLLTSLRPGKGQQYSPNHSVRSPTVPTIIEEIPFLVEASDFLLRNHKSFQFLTILDILRSNIKV